MITERLVDIPPQGDSVARVLEVSTDTMYVTEGGASLQAFAGRRGMLRGDWEGYQPVRQPISFVPTGAAYVKPLQAVFSAITNETLIDDPRITSQPLVIDSNGVVRARFPIDAAGRQLAVDPNAPRDPLQAVTQGTTLPVELLRAVQASQPALGLAATTAAPVMVQMDGSAGVLAQLLDQVGGARTAWIVAGVLVVLFFVMRRR